MDVEGPAGDIDTSGSVTLQASEKNAIGFLLPLDNMVFAGASVKIGFWNDGSGRDVFFRPIDNDLDYFVTHGQVAADSEEWGDSSWKCKSRQVFPGLGEEANKKYGENHRCSSVRKGVFAWNGDYIVKVSVPMQVGSFSDEVRRGTTRSSGSDEGRPEFLSRGKYSGSDEGRPEFLAVCGST